jgi:hypothetical protein
MSIPQRKYVAIESGTVPDPVVTERQLILRLATTNQLVPTKTLVEFTNDLKAIAAYFGADSEEYKRAAFNLNTTTKKQLSKPTGISFARWAQTDAAPQIFGEPGDQLLANWTVISDGSITLTLGVDTEIITGIDFTTDLSLSDVAATLQAAINAANVASMWTGAVVAWNAVDKRFDFTGGDFGSAVVVVALGGSGTEIASMLGWLNDGTILSNGADAETITEFLDLTVSQSTNFGHVIFMPTLSLEEMTEAAVWVDGQNVRYQYHAPVSLANAALYQAALAPYSGTSLTIDEGVTDEFPEQVPANIYSAVDYAKRDANQNTMFYRTFALTPSVTDKQTSDTLDAINVNYWGQTQSDGANVSFYQRGKLQGTGEVPVDMNTFSNEQWFKAANASSIMNLLLAEAAVTANPTGVAKVLNAIQPNIETAQLNGTIIVGKELTQAQISFINDITNGFSGAENAHFQVQTIGYWIDAKVVADPLNPGEFKIDYLLVYSKGDIIRFVEGLQISV